MGRKRVMPRENVEYTFCFGPGKYYKFIYMGTNEANGRLFMFNVVAKTVRTMEPERFSYIHRFNLISEREIPTTKAAPLPEPKIIKEPEPDLSVEEAKIIRTLKNLTAENRSKVIAAIGKTPEDLAYDLQHAADDAAFGTYIMLYSKAMDAVKGTVNSISAL